MERVIYVRHNVTGHGDGETRDKAHAHLQTVGLTLHHLDPQKGGKTEDLQKHPPERKEKKKLACRRPTLLKLHGPMFLAITVSNNSP